MFVFRFLQPYVTSSCSLQPPVLLRCPCFCFVRRVFGFLSFATVCVHFKSSVFISFAQAVLFELPSVSFVLSASRRSHFRRSFVFCVSVLSFALPSVFLRLVRATVNRNCLFDMCCLRVCSFRPSLFLCFFPSRNNSSHCVCKPHSVVLYWNQIPRHANEPYQRL